MKKIIIKSIFSLILLFILSISCMAIAIQEENVNESDMVKAATASKEISEDSDSDSHDGKVYAMTMVKNTSVQDNLSKSSSSEKETSPAEMIRSQLSKGGIDLDQIKDAGRINVEPRKISLKGAQINMTGDSMRVQTPAGQIEIIPRQTNVQMRDRNMIVNAKELSIEDGEIFFEDRKIQLPADAIDSVPRSRLSEIDLIKEGSTIQYQYQMNTTKRLLGLIPMNAKEHIRVNAENGELVAKKGPWWNFLAIG